MTPVAPIRSYAWLVPFAWVALAAASSLAQAQGATAAPSPPTTPTGGETEAKASFDQGLMLAREERWAEAAAAFERARASVARPSILFNLASVRYRLGQLVESRAVLAQYFDATHEGETNHEEALRLHAVLEQDIPLLTLLPTPDSAEVLIDGKPDGTRGAERTLLLDPGDHRIDVHAEGYTAQTLEVRLERAMRLRQEIQLQRAPVVATRVQLPESSARPGPLSPLNHDDRAADDDRHKGGLLSSPVFWVATLAVIGGGVATALLLANNKGTKLADATGGTTGIKLTAPGGK